MFRSPLFAWSPRPDYNQDLETSPETQSPSRFGAFRSSVRSMVNGSSIYSQPPALPNTNNHNETTPKIPFLGFWNRSPDPNTLLTSNDAPHESHDSHSPLRAQHSASSYIGVIEDPQVPTTVYARHPADVPLPSHQQQDGGYVDPESQQSAEDVNGRRHRRKKHRRRKHHRTERSRRSERSDRWVRRRDEPRTAVIYVRGTAARGKMIACVISGTFLITVLAIYLAIALTNRSLGQEIHILFIMVLLTITIFFCHSLIRLCMMMLNPPSASSSDRPRMPNMTDADGFQPIVPIRVHLRRDEEVAAADDAEREREVDVEKEVLPPPPPAYGLWRSSVRVDPNLLHWQRAEDVHSNDNDRGSTISSTAVQSRAASVTSPSTPLGPSPLAASSARGSEPVGPRPPSYASEDGVSYIIEAAPRSTVNIRESGTGFSDVHPAWRPGYAMSEIRGGEIPGSVDRSYRG